MAPTKRGAPTKAAPAKRAKTSAPEGPIVDFLGKCDEIPKPCQQMLQAAVPFCLEVVEADRHKFQVEVLARVAAIFAIVETKKREVIAGYEAELAEITRERDSNTAEVNAKNATAAGKNTECEEKGKVVDAAREVSNGANKALADAQAAKTEFDNKKAGLLAEQESFAKLLAEVFQPLKDGTLQCKGLQKSRFLDQLKKKLKEVGAQESLGDALVATLKMTADKREGTFAKTTIQFSEEYFDKHTKKVAQDIGRLDAEEAQLNAAIAGAEAVASEKKGAREALEKEWDAMQDIWVGLSGEATAADKALKKIEAQIPKVTKNIDKANFDLEKFLEVPALFATLKEKSTAAPEEPEPEEAADDAAPEEPEKAEE